MKTFLVRYVLVNFSIFRQLFHMFGCFVPSKISIVNLTMCFELNYLYSSLKSFLILSEEPKKYFNSPKQGKWLFPKNYNVIPKPGGKFGMKFKTSHKKYFHVKFQILPRYLSVFK